MLQDMMFNKRTVGAVVICLFAVLIAAPIFNVLTLVDVKRDAPVLYIMIKDKQEFVISFTHSVNKRPVHDYIRIDGNHFVITKSRYDSFGAGMPETAIDGMNLKLGDDGMLELTNINRSLPEITVFVGTIAEHILRVGNRTIPLAQLVIPGEALRFTLEKVSLFNLLRVGVLSE